MNSKQTALNNAQGPNGPARPIDEVVYINANQSLIENAITKIKALQPQPDDPQLKAIYSGVDQLTQLASKAVDAVLLSDQTTFDTVSKQADALAAKLDGESIAYGLDECGKESTQPPA